MSKARYKFADVAVTPTAKEFQGIYRNKKQHDCDFDAVLDRALAAGVEKVVLTGMTLHDVDFIVNIVKSRPQQCCFTIGVHPYHASEPETEGPEYMQTLASKVNDILKETPSVLAAFGELGLDYDRLNHAPKDIQLRTFTSQLDLIVAQGWDLPLFLHCRAAFEDFVDTIKAYIPKLPRGGLVHSFVGTKGQMMTLTELGLHVSVNGFSFQNQDSLEMIKAIPLDKLQIETDAPWGLIPTNSELAQRYPSPMSLPPSRKRDKFAMGCMVKERNESCTIAQVASIVAGLRGVEFEDIMEAAWTNSTRMFGLVRKDG